MCNQELDSRIWKNFIWLQYLPHRASVGAHLVKNLLAMQESWVRSLGWEDPLEKEKATHSSILAWRSPWTKQPGGLQSWSHKELDMPERWSTHIHIELIICHYPVESACKAGDTGDEDSIRGLGISSGEGNGNLLQYSYQENLMDRGAWWAIVHGVTKSRTWLKLLSSCA